MKLKFNKLNNAKWRIASIALVLIFAISAFPTKNIDAAGYAEYLRIGLFYGGSETPSVAVSAAGGFSLGYYSDRTFVPISSTSSSAITVQRDDASGYPYHLRYAHGISAAEAQNLVAQLSGEGIMAYAAYINGEIGVWGGMYPSVADAEAAAGADSHAPMPMDMSNDRICALDSQGRIVFLFGSGGTGFGARPNFSNPMDEKLTISGVSYRGGLDFRRKNGGAMTIVNVVNTEQYLYGVISREMSPSWPIEALKAQAVCARVYAFNSLGKHNSDGFDLCPTVHCQAYGGILYEDERSFAPVDRTAGEVLRYNGNLAQAFYCSSTGPNTESVEYVWGTAFPYLVSVDNSYEKTAEIPNGVWNSTITADKATAVMDNVGKGVGQVTNIEVVERTPAGRVMKLRVAGTGGEVVLEREECRNVFSNFVKSRLYTVIGNNDAETADSAALKMLFLWNGKAYREITPNEVYIIGGDGTIVQQAELYILTKDGSHLFGSESENVSEPGVPSTEWSFSGMGWGHGVGMSQYGAKGMAEAGISYKDILTHYFSGTTVEKAY